MPKGSLELVGRNGYQLGFTHNGYLEQNLQGLEEKLIDQDDKDMVILVVGSPGNGKSALTLWCQIFLALQDVQPDIEDVTDLKDILDSDELFKGWVYEHDAFCSAVRNNGGILINYDEGYDSFYRRRAMSKKNTEAMSMMWKYRFKNHVIFINFQNVSDIEPDLLYKRVHGMIRVVKKGWFHFFSQNKINEIDVDSKTKKVSFPKPDFKGSFPDPANYIPEIWKDYKTNNEESLEDQAEKKENEDSEPTNWLSTGQVTERLDVSGDTVRKWCNDQVINSKRLPNGDRRIPESELEKLLED